MDRTWLPAGNQVPPATRWSSGLTINVNVTGASPVASAFGRADAADYSVVEKLPAFHFVVAAPDAVGLADAKGVVQARPLDRTGGADGLGLGLPELLVILTLEV
jgi:hypothetical protein